MKKLLLLGALLFSALTFSQTILLNETFNSGVIGDNFTTSGSGENSWVVNNSYAGYPGFIPDTPDQPTQISGYPQSYYLHIVNATACGGLSVCNANYDTGSPSNVNADLNAGINTVGMSGITVEFWYLCAGQNGVAFGTFDYSVDGGTTWTNVAAYSGVTTWTQESVSLPEWDDQADLRIRFNWQNGGSGVDPAFAVDELLITAGSVEANEITTAPITGSDSVWCEGENQVVNIDFEATGTYGAGNVYTAQISDAGGSFASPTAIGTLNSSANGMLNMTGIISGGIPAGSYYLYRVVASDPAIMGTAGGHFNILPAPSVSMSTFFDVCEGDAVFALSGGNPAGGTYSGVGVSSNIFDPASAGIGSHLINYTYTDGNGCSNDAQEYLTVVDCSSLDEENSMHFLLYPNPSNTDFSIQTSKEIEGVQLVDISGKVVRTFAKDKENYSVKGLSKGTYFVKVQLEDTYSVQQLVIE